MNDTISDDAVSYWTVHCTPGGSLCDEGQNFVVIVTGSDDVVLRYENSLTAGNGDVARVSAKESDSLVAQLMMIDGLPVLELSAKEGNLDVVLLRKERVHQVVNQGSGNVAVHDGVLVTSGPGLTVSALGSGDVSLTASTITVDDLTLSSQGSGRLQASFSEVKVKTASVEVSSSADATVIVESSAATDSLAVSVQGSGSLCLTAGSSIDTNQLNIKKIGAGDVSLGPRGSCQDAKLTTTGPGTVDAGGIQCKNVNVDLLGNGNVVVQATGTLSGDVYGSGHLKYYGNAPKSIDNVNYMGLVTASPVSSAYHPSGCTAKQFPLKPTDTVEASSSSGGGDSVGEEFSYHVTIDQSNIVYLAAVVFLVALALRWFNESRRRAREEQRQPLVGAGRRVYM
ncbi:hypothetical protein F441_18522 [Phytophthora nicotianae CJ01A1]|uniref:Putative auto-transporter adhesin head GIN domain-containing protein n=3 Tax=Phytophthora nicotianae TaxID=4792 RepID=V9E796_PHYNI|nr:hypothetical protein F443_18661 [Phytophthora nicotianae P1569]ETK75221.1 hypothetical protein L915_18143 [Phytophthora nicotianae]ETL28646.1 hypothetical protein L916_18046 [Phytophthora nicotianae]ETM35104.1 hypothetical protein L914_17949 [Phytophthora nicotianae]ETP04807.1 hypothetical protein F441_18522 [Phytophthora nicotianae CJ01A1]